MHTMDSSATKTHLLLQAHFCQLQLPSSDYYTDTKSVMDQAIRILQVQRNSPTVCFASNRTQESRFQVQITESLGRSRLTRSTQFAEQTMSGTVVRTLLFLQAMLDVAADKGWLVSALRIIQLVQMVVQGRWVHDHPLLCLPGVQPNHIACFRWVSSVREREPLSCISFVGETHI